MSNTLFPILLAFSAAFSKSVDEANNGDTNMEKGASASMFNALKEISTEETNFKALSLLKESWVTKCSHLNLANGNFACNISMPQVRFHFASMSGCCNFYSARVNIAGLKLRATFVYNKVKVDLVHVDACTIDLVAVPDDFRFRTADELMNAFKEGLNSCIPTCQHSFSQSDQLSESRAGIDFENP